MLKSDTKVRICLKEEFKNCEKYEENHIFISNFFNLFLMKLNVNYTFDDDVYWISIDNLKSVRNFFSYLKNNYLDIESGEMNIILSGIDVFIAKAKRGLEMEKESKIFDLEVLNIKKQKVLLDLKQHLLENGFESIKDFEIIFYEDEEKLKDIIFKFVISYINDLK